MLGEMSRTKLMGNKNYVEKCRRDVSSSSIRFGGGGNRCGHAVSDDLKARSQCLLCRKNDKNKTKKDLSVPIETITRYIFGGRELDFDENRPEDYTQSRPWVFAPDTLLIIPVVAHTTWFTITVYSVFACCVFSGMRDTSRDTLV